MNVKEKLQALRREMAAEHIDAYLIPTEDFHGSEYVGTYFKSREYVSGFTGSAGTLVVTPSFAGLWTDGRYFLQAADQLQGTEITLMKMNEPGVLPIPAYLASVLSDNSVIGFDGRTVSRGFADSLTAAFGSRSVRLFGTEDLVGRIWSDRPALSRQPVWELPVSAAGCSRARKLSDLRTAMEAHNCDLMVISALDEIAWLLNLRGDDVACTPVFLAYLILTREKALLFAQDVIFSPEILSLLAADGVELHPYFAVESTLAELSAGQTVWADENALSWSLCNAVSGAKARCSDPDPVPLMKAVKNEVEQRGMREAHLRDGVACTRFLFWLKKNIGKIPMTELSASEMLLNFRRQQEGFLEPSFDTIFAYGPHAAIVHYEPTPETDCPLQPQGLCLIDSGAQYCCGTTDITRTVALGPVTEEEKKAFTLVLKGHLALGDAEFRHGVTGSDLDVLAREPLWKEGLDFNHGTGHGVGFVLSVHEDPPRVRFAGGPGGRVALENGMIFSNEPGFYADGRFGIRHENLVLVQAAHPGFHSLLPLTLVPFDRDGLELSLLTKEDRCRLNSYHARVREELLPFLAGEERDWLLDVTEPLPLTE